MSAKRLGIWAALVVGLGLSTPLQAAIKTIDSVLPANNASARATWLNDAGVTAPAFAVDFESGFTNGQNVHDSSGLFPGGLIIRADGTGQALVASGLGSIGGSDPVGTMALKIADAAVLVLDFSANPVDYVGFLHIDHNEVNSFDGGFLDFGRLTLVGGEQVQMNLDAATAAEFLGIVRLSGPRITTVEFKATGDGIWGIDNIEYGVVPLPATAWLLFSALGCAGFAAGRWRRS